MKGRKSTDRRRADILLSLCGLLTLDEEAFATMWTLATYILSLDQKTETEMGQKKAGTIAKRLES